MTTTWEMTDSNGVTWYWWIYPTDDGYPELAYDSSEPSGVQDSDTAGEWVFRTHTMGESTSGAGVTYLAFEDSGGSTWYVYAGTDGAPIISDVAPA